MKRWLSLAVLLAALVLTVSACGKNKDTLYFLNFKPESAEAFNKIATVYEKETGKKMRVVTAASGTYEQTLKSEIGKSDAPTLFIVNGPVGYASWKDYCLDLKDSELYGHLTDKGLALTSGDGVYGIPYVVEGYGIIYNKAITDRYFALQNRSTSVGSMEEIRSFEQLKAVVEDMTAHKKELGIEGVFASTSLKSGEDWRWQTHLANVPMYYEFEQDGISVADGSVPEVSFRYSDQYRNIFDLYINNSVTDPKLLGTKQVADSMAEFALGKCAMVQNGNWAWSQIAGIDGNTVAEENIRMIPIYTGIEGEENQGLCIGTENYLAVNKRASAEKQQAALDFLNWLFTSETGKELVTDELEFITPFDTFEADEQPNDPLAAEIAAYLADDTRTSVPWVFQLFPSQNFKNDFGANLLKYAQGNLSWEQVKSGFISKWKSEAQ